MPNKQEAGIAPALAIIFLFPVLAPKHAAAQNATGSIVPLNDPPGVISGGSANSTGQLIATCYGNNYLPDTVTNIGFGNGPYAVPPPSGLSVTPPSTMTTTTDPVNNPVPYNFTVSASTSVSSGRWWGTLVGQGTSDYDPPGNCSGTNQYGDGDYLGLWEAIVLPVANVARQDLTDFTVSGSPSTGFSGLNGGGNSGPAVIQISMEPMTGQQSCYGKTHSSGTVPFTNCPTPIVSPATVNSTAGTFQFLAPSNPLGLTFNPGQLGLGYLNFGYPSASGTYGAGGYFAVASAGTTYYVVANEGVWGYPAQDGTNGTCTTLRIAGTLYSGAILASDWFGQDVVIEGYFCEAFLADWNLQGSAVLNNPANPSYLNQTIKYNAGIPAFQTPLTGSDGWPLHPIPGQTGDTMHTIARDFTIIPETPYPNSQPYVVTMVNAASSINIVAQATDTGGAFMARNGENNNGGYGYNHFDYFLGAEMSKPPIGGLWKNPMVVFGCNEAPPAPQALAQYITTLCPTVTDNLTDPFLVGQARVRPPSQPNATLSRGLKP